jgi:hypothetical protein
MPKISKSPLSVDQVAEKASRREDVSAHFTNKSTVVNPVRHMNADPTQSTLREPDHQPADVIKRK